MAAQSRPVRTVEAMLQHNAPAGWYPDPWNPGGYRWWSGASYTYHSSPAPSTAPRSVPLRGALRAVTAAVAVLVAVKALSGALGQMPLLAMLLGPLFYAASAALCVSAARAGGPVKDQLGFRLLPVDLGLGVAGYVAVVAVSVAVGVVLSILGVPVASNNPFGGGARAPGSGSSAGVLLYVFTLVVVVAPIVEEILLRGLLLRALETRISPVAAVSAQAVLFGALHADTRFGAGNIGLVLVLMSTGMVLGVLSHVTGRIGPSIVAHMVFNGVAFTVGAGAALGR